MEEEGGRQLRDSTKRSVSQDIEQEEERVNLQESSSEPPIQLSYSSSREGCAVACFRLRLACLCVRRPAPRGYSLPVPYWTTLELLSGRSLKC